MDKKEYIYHCKNIFEKTLYFVRENDPKKALEFFEKAFIILDKENKKKKY